MSSVMDAIRRRTAASDIILTKMNLRDEVIAEERARGTVAGPVPGMMACPPQTVHYSERFDAFIKGKNMNASDKMVLLHVMRLNDEERVPDGTLTHRNVAQLAAMSGIKPDTASDVFKRLVGADILLYARQLIQTVNGYRQRVTLGIKAGVDATKVIVAQARPKTSPRPCEALPCPDCGSDETIPYPKRLCLDCGSIHDTPKRPRRKRMAVPRTGGPVRAVSDLTRQNLSLVPSVAVEGSAFPPVPLFFESEQDDCDGWEPPPAR